MDIQTLLEHSINQLNVHFKLNNKSLTSKNIVNNKTLVASIIKRADQLCSFCLNTSLNINFNKKEDSDIDLEFNDNTSHTLIMLCAIEIIIEIIETAPDTNNVNLDDLLYD